MGNDAGIAEVLLSGISRVERCIGLLLAKAEELLVEREVGWW